MDVRRLKGDLWRKIDSFVSIKREKTEPKMQNDVDEPTHPEVKSVPFGLLPLLYPLYVIVIFEGIVRHV